MIFSQAKFDAGISRILLTIRSLFLHAVLNAKNGELNTFNVQMYTPTHNSRALTEMVASTPTKTIKVTNSYTYTKIIGLINFLLNSINSLLHLVCVSEGGGCDRIDVYIPINQNMLYFVLCMSVCLFFERVNECVREAHAKTHAHTCMCVCACLLECM